MRVLRVIASVDPAYGGPVTTLRDSVAALAMRGCESEILTGTAPSDPATMACPIHRVPLARIGRWVAANAARFDAAVLHGVWSPTILAAGRALARAGVPTVMFPHGMLDRWFATRSGARAGFSRAAKKAVWHHFMSGMVQNVRSVLLTSVEEQAGLDPAFPIPRARQKLVRYGISPPPPRTGAMDRAFRNAIPALGGRPYVLYLGRLHAKKGLPRLLAAFAEVTAHDGHCDLVLAGPGSPAMLKDLDLQIAAAGLAGRVHRPGPLYGDAKWGALYGARCLALLSHQENFAVSVAEALGCGVSAVVSDAVALASVVSHTQCGTVVYGQTDTAAEAISHWVALSDPERVETARRARRAFDKYCAAGPAADDLLGELLAATRAREAINAAA